MTVSELITVLQTRPPEAPVLVWDGDCAEYSDVEAVSLPIEHSKTIPRGAVVIWGT